MGIVLMGSGLCQGWFLPSGSEDRKSAVMKAVGLAGRPFIDSSKSTIQLWRGNAHLRCCSQVGQRATGRLIVVLTAVVVILIGLIILIVRDWRSLIMDPVQSDSVTFAFDAELNAALT